jgi:hypothetical protein
MEAMNMVPLLHVTVSLRLSCSTQNHARSSNDEEAKIGNQKWICLITLSVRVDDPKRRHGLSSAD